MPYQVEVFTSGPVETNSFLLWDTDKRGLLIDTPPDSFPSVVQSIEEKGINLEAIVLTHTHWDHTADITQFDEKFGDALTVYVHPDDEYRLEDPMKHLLWAIPLQMEPFKPDRHLDHGDKLTIGEMDFEIIHAPGHTQGSICLHDRLGDKIFVGDVIFSGSVGRTDLPGGDWDTLMRSIVQHILPLPDTAQVFPGHGPLTTIGEERAHNPFVGG